MEFFKKLKNGNFEINRETLEELLKSHYMFQALQGAKVDKWEWYYDARRNYLEEASLGVEEPFESIDELVNFQINSIE